MELHRLRAVFADCRKPTKAQDEHMGLQKITLLILILVAVLWLPVGSTTAQIFSGTNRTRASRGPNYFAIMGHIKHPMACQLPMSAPSLVDFIQFAGGALKSTTGEVRIVRGGRIAQQTMLTENSKIKLMPGDLVIIDGWRGKTFRGGSNRGGSGGESERLHQIALIGIQPHPVIMQMTPDVATKRWILQQLRQDLSIAGSVKVVARRNSGALPGIDTRLTDNSVLYFADGLINTAALPRLPVPFRAGIDRRPGQKGSASNQSSASSAAAQLSLPITQPLPEAPAESPVRPGYTDILREPAKASIADLEATREILTHPNSVPLEERQPTLPGRAHVGDTGSASVGQPSRERRALAPHDDLPIRFNPEADPQEQTEGVSETEAPLSEFVAPETVKPFVFYSDQKPAPVMPQSANSETTPGEETSALQLTPVAPREKPDTATFRVSTPAVETLAAPERVGRKNPPDSEPATLAKPKERLDTAVLGSLPRAIPVSEIDERETYALSLADRSADELANSLREKPSSKPANTDSVEEEVTTTAMVEATPKGASVFNHGNGIAPYKDKGASWPLIAAGFIGSLGFLATFGLLLSMAGRTPPTPAKAAKSDREVPGPHFLSRRHQTGVGQTQVLQPDMPDPGDKPGQAPTVVPRAPTAVIPATTTTVLEPACSIVEQLPRKRPRLKKQEQKIPVQPAKSVEDSSDLLGRILARVETLKNQTNDEQQTGRRWQNEQL